MNYKIINISMENEFKVCPSCRYKDGFHSMLKKEGGVTKWFFICPSCHNVFDIDHLPQVFSSHSKSEVSKIQEKNNVTTNGNELYKIIWKEIEENKKDIGLWANCFSKCEGDEDKTKALYVNKRVLVLKENLPKQLIDQERKIKEELEKERKVTVKPKPTKKKKNFFFRMPVIILLLIFLLSIGGYIASVITGYKIPAIDHYIKKHIQGYKIPAIDHYIKKHIPEISEAKPIPNQKSVNGRFVTNSTAGNLFVLTGRIENPSNITYSHIEIRGALITTNKEEAKIKNVFCGNIITEDMLKTGNISDINTLLTLKEGAHKINVNVAPGASVPFMVVFSDLPEKLENFTVKVAGFDKAVNKP